MLGDIASLQPLFAGIIFLWAGAWKVVSSRSGGGCGPFGAGLVVSAQQHRPADSPPAGHGRIGPRADAPVAARLLVGDKISHRVGDRIRGLPALLDKSSTRPALCLSGWARGEDLRAYARSCHPHSAQHPSRLVHITVLVDDGSYSPLDTGPGCPRTSHTCRAFT